MKPRISMITLGVKNLELSISFYEQGLGLPRMESSPEVAFFTLNGSWLGLFNRDALADDANISPEGSGFNSFSLSHNVNSEKEVDKIFAEAIEAGGTLVKQPVKAPWGGYHGYFRDPDDHLWEIAYNPFFWVGPPDEEN